MFFLTAEVAANNSSSFDYLGIIAIVISVFSAIFTFIQVLQNRIFLDVNFMELHTITTIESVVNVGRKSLNEKFYGIVIGIRVINGSHHNVSMFKHDVIDYHSGRRVFSTKKEQLPNEGCGLKYASLDRDYHQAVNAVSVNSNVIAANSSQKINFIIGLKYLEDITHLKVSFQVAIPSLKRYIPNFVFTFLNKFKRFEHLNKSKFKCFTKIYDIQSSVAKITDYRNSKGND